MGTTGTSGRTRLITLGTIVAVAVAGAVAISANLGILKRVGHTSVGTITAADLKQPALLEPVPLQADPLQAASALTGTAQGPVVGDTDVGVQQFTVDAAGRVGVSQGAWGISVHEVVPSKGWTWKLTQTSPSKLAVTLRNGVRTLEFAAVGDPDGQVTGSVTEHNAIAAAAPGAKAPTAVPDNDGTYKGGDDDD